MVYSPHSHPSTHKYDASPTSKNVDYSALDGPDNKDMYEAIDKSRYDALKEYIKKDDQGLISKDYQSNKAEEENKKQKIKDTIESNIEKEEKKGKNESDTNQNIDITKKAAEEIRIEINKNKDDFKKKKDLKSIEEAINKAINEEKETIHNN